VVATVLLQRWGVAAWWVVPVVVVLALSASLHRAERRSRRGSASADGT
jgi:hypothetical protein